MSRGQTINGVAGWSAGFESPLRLWWSKIREEITRKVSQRERLRKKKRGDKEIKQQRDEIDAEKAPRADIEAPGLNGARPVQQKAPALLPGLDV